MLASMPTASLSSPSVVPIRSRQEAPHFVSFQDGVETEVGEWSAVGWKGTWGCLVRVLNARFHPFPWAVGSHRKFLSKRSKVI